MTAFELMKSIRRKKTRCKRGHPLNSVTVYEHPKGYICCRVCISEQVRRYYQRNSDAIKAHKREYRKLKRAA